MVIYKSYSGIKQKYKKDFFFFFSGLSVLSLSLIFLLKYDFAEQRAFFLKCNTWVN